MSRLKANWTLWNLHSFLLTMTPEQTPGAASIGHKPAIKAIPMRKKVVSQLAAAQASLESYNKAFLNAP